MRKPGLATVGFGLIGIGSSLFAAPAMAAVNCGTAPTGGTLTQSGDYCQLVFSTPGDYTFTVPASANQLFALVVGGGAGATTDANAYHEGYAGSAGKVHYKDMSDSIAYDLSIHIGEGGPSGSDSALTNGSDSSVSSPATSNYAVSWGAPGTQTTTNTACQEQNWTGGIISVGEGARTRDNLVATSNACLNGQGKGVNPSLENVDSDGNSVPAIFSDLNATFGTGGQTWSDGRDTPFAALQPGDGAGFQTYWQQSTFRSIQNRGGNGIAYLRWRHVASLATTGSNSLEVSALAAGLIALGTGLTVASRVRRRASK
ncbi:MAG: hypothetical protein RLY83_780 [Actinomycetota bacterium]|jgi:hypothetical protein